MSDWPLARRQTHLANLVQEKSEFTHAIGIRNGREDFSVYSVPIELPRYRIQNMRTSAAQREYIKLNNVPDNFFEDPDSVEAQSVQHQILWTMVERTELLDVMRKSQQTDPLILTREGYVVNGNRRLCAMRTLYQEDASDFARFRMIRVIILPADFVEDEIRRLEAELQIYPETKLDYSWIDIALTKRGFRDSGMTENEIASLYKEKPQALQVQIGSLELAEAYLLDRGKEQLYSQLPKGEHTFFRLYDGLKKTDSAPQRELLKELVFTIIDDTTGFGTVYHKIPDLVKHLPKVAEALVEEVQVAGVETEEDSELDDLLGPASDSDTINYEALTAAIREGKLIEADYVRDIVVDTLDEIKGDEKSRNDAEQVFRLVKLARTKLQDAVTAFNEKTNTDGILPQLEQIERSVSELRGRTDESGSSRR